jgi:hypothetical protein
MTAKSVIFTGRIETRDQLAKVFHTLRESNQATFNQAKAAVGVLACYLPTDLVLEQRTPKSVITCNMPDSTVTINNRAKARQIWND